MLRNQERKERKSEYAENRVITQRLKKYSQVFFKKGIFVWEIYVYSGFKVYV